METKKIAISCFVGGVIGTAVALLCAPIFWWLGMLTGFGAGYLCYDFKEIREKIPVAWKYAIDEVLPEAKERLAKLYQWLIKPHPFLLAAIIFLFLPPYPAYIICGKDTFMSIGVSLGLFLVFFAAFWSLVHIGTSKHKFGKNCYWFFWSNYEGLGENEIGLTYRNIYGLFLRGILIVFYELGRFSLIFFPKLFVLIHSRKRVLCGIDSAIGVAIAYISIGTSAVTFQQKIVAVICGGIIGAAVGVAHYKFAKIVHLIPKVNGI